MPILLRLAPAGLTAKADSVVPFGVTPFGICRPKTSSIPIHRDFSHASARTGAASVSGLLAQPRDEQHPDRGL